jgi:hypothetical protein
VTYDAPAGQSQAGVCCSAERIFYAVPTVTAQMSYAIRTGDEQAVRDTDK